VPWKETCSMDQRRRFVLEWRSGTVSRTALCQLFGISRKTGYKWVKSISWGPRACGPIPPTSQKPNGSRDLARGCDRHSAHEQRPHEALGNRVPAEGQRLAGMNPAARVAAKAPRPANKTSAVIRPPK
jgi:Helix-turn-helix domain